LTRVNARNHRHVAHDTPPEERPTCGDAVSDLILHSPRGYRYSVDCNKVDYCTAPGEPRSVIPLPFKRPTVSGLSGAPRAAPLPSKLQGRGLHVALPLAMRMRNPQFLNAHFKLSLYPFIFSPTLGCNHMGTSDHPTVFVCSPKSRTLPQNSRLFLPLVFYGIRPREPFSGLHIH